MGDLGRGRHPRPPAARASRRTASPTTTRSRPRSARGGHTVFTGDRIGVYHPDVTAPGVDISSTCDTAGTVVGPCPPGREHRPPRARAWPRPHVAGAAAVLLQANPTLTPDQVRLALQATAQARSTDHRTARRAVLAGRLRLRRSRRGGRPRAQLEARSRACSSAQAADDARARGDRRCKVAQVDIWPYDAPRAAVRHRLAHVLTAPVGSKTTHLKVTLVPPVARRLRQRHGVHGHGQGRGRQGDRHDDRGRPPAPAPAATFIDLARPPPPSTARSRSRSAASRGLRPGHARQRLGPRPRGRAPGRAADVPQLG